MLRINCLNGNALIIEQFHLNEALNRLKMFTYTQFLFKYIQFLTNKLPQVTALRPQKIPMLIEIQFEYLLPQTKYCFIKLCTQSTKNLSLVSHSTTTYKSFFIVEETVKAETSTNSNSYEKCLRTFHFNCLYAITSLSVSGNSIQ